MPAQMGSNGTPMSSVSKYNTWLPEIYMGPPDRLQRYVQYEQMDMDHEIAGALNIIAQFCTQPNESIGNIPFQFNFQDTPSPTESKLLDRALKQWCAINEFNNRLFKIFRSTLMYGDQFFIRDPDTYKLYWVDPNKVEKIIVNESQGKEVETYFIKDIDFNIQTLVASNQSNKTASGFINTANFSAPYFSQQTSAGSGQSSNSSYSSQGGANNTSAPIDASYVVHISMTEGLDSAWPFGISILETIFKVFKQKTMLEDALLIYRIHRAPERRVFFIDTGNLPPNKALQYLERVKYDVQQKRIPNRTGGGQNVVDAAYNPLSTLEDYFFAVGADGRGSKVDTLPGGENLGEINDMLYFNNKMLRALGVPSSYLPTGPSDGTASSSDGRVGSALIQEFTFSETCKRHQRQIIRTFDREFKLFLKHKGITIDNSMFDLAFTPPQNFARYRQIELDAAQASVFATMQEVKYVSKRFALKRYLGWTDEEMHENERLWAEENQGKKKNNGPGADGTGAPGLGQVGISSSDMAPEEGEMDLGDEGMDDMGSEVSDTDVENFGEE